MNIYQSKTYGKDLSWLHLDDKPRVEVKDYSLTFPFLCPPVEYLLNDHEDHPSQHKNSHELCDETVHPLLSLTESQWKLRQYH